MNIASSQTLVQPPAVLLMGPSGTGKTDVLTQTIAEGLELFVLVTEPRGTEILYDSIKRRGLDASKLHWKYVGPAAPGWKALLDMGTKISQMGYKDLSELKSGVGKSETQQFMQVLNSVAAFTDQHGRNYGDVTEWGPDRVFAIDSLSGLNLMAMSLTIGYKPAAHQGEWGVAMNLLEQFLLTMTSNLHCLFVLTAHLDREVDEVMGGTKLMVSALGRKLAPRIPRFFSEVVLTVREGSNFFWSTSGVGVDLKFRALPIAERLTPTFKPIVDAYKRRLAEAAPATVAAKP